MKSPRLFFGLIAAAGLFYACEFGTAPGGGGTGAEGLTGILVDTHGVRVAGAKVRVYPDSLTALAKGSHAFAAMSDSTYTKADGSFKFAKLSEGDYRLEASFKREDTTFAILRRGIHFTGKLDLGADTLQATGGLRLHVRNTANEPVKGAQCAIPGASWKVTSDDMGACVFTGIPPGSYQVSVALSGNQGALTNAVVVISGEEANGGDVKFAADGGSEIITGEWILTSAQGYTFYIRNDMKLTSDASGIDSWGASYESPSLNMDLYAGLAPSLPRPSEYPEYSETTIQMDSDLRAVLVHYRLPDSVAAVGGKFRYIAGLQVEQAHVSGPSTLWVPTIIFRTYGLMSEDQVRALYILGSVRKWVSSGPIPASMPPVPKLNLPTNNTFSAAISPTLSWALNPGSTLTTYYRLQVSPDSSFSVFATNDSVGVPSLGPVSHTVGPLASGTLYYWRVIGVGAGGGSMSEVRRFTTAGHEPVAPILSLPADEVDSIFPWSTVLSWQSPSAGSASISSYRVQVSMDSLFNSVVFADTLSAETTSVTVPYLPAFFGSGWSLLDGTRYYWRVIADGPTGSTVSAVWRFTTLPYTPLARPLIAPLVNDVNVPLSPMLFWGFYADGDFYQYLRVQVAKDSLFTVPIVNDSVSIPVYMAGAATWTVGPLEPSTRYFWRVLTYGRLEAVAYSETRAFTTTASP